MIATSHPEPPDKSSWQGKSAAERQEWTKNFYVNHPDPRRIFSDFIQKLEHCERSKKYQAMLVIGPTGSGKTTLTGRMLTVARELYSRQDNEKTVCPVIQFAVPDPCTPLEFSIAILTALGDPDPRGRKSRSGTIKAAESFLRECEVKLVLLDNFQDIPARRARRGIELVSARLRELIDHSNALWVFLGTGEAQKVVNSDPQLIKRVSYRAKLRYFGIKDDRGKVFKRVLAELDAWLPLTQPSCLVGRGTAGLMYVATEGIFERIVQLVDRGWYVAVEAGREVMCLSDLEAAYTYVHGPQADNANPFHPSFTMRRLIDQDDPYENLRGDE